MDRILAPSRGWTDDSLTELIETAHRNRFATFEKKKGWSQRLIALDGCFMRIAKDWLNPTNRNSPRSSAIGLVHWADSIFCA